MLVNAEKSLIKQYFLLHRSRWLVRWFTPGNTQVIFRPDFCFKYGSVSTFRDLYFAEILSLSVTMQAWWLLWIDQQVSRTLRFAKFYRINPVYDFSGRFLLQVCGQAQTTRFKEDGDQLACKQGSIEKFIFMFRRDLLIDRKIFNKLCKA